MKGFLARLLAAFGTCLALLAPFAAAHALTVQPAIEEVQADPGKGDTKFLKITNDEDSTQTFFVTIQKFVPKGENGQQEFLPLTDTKGLPEWMYVDKPQVTLKPGESDTLQVSIRVPPGAAPGGYYAALFLAKRQNPEDALAMLPRLGVLFFVRVNGNLQEHLSLTSFAVDKDSYDSLPVGFRTVIANEGMVHEQPVGTIRVRNLFGQTVASFSANPEGNRILPASSHVLLSRWEKGEGWSGFAIGPYVATVTFNGPGFSGDVTREVRFSVWPWRLMAYAAGLLVLLVFLAVVFRKLVLHHATSRTQT